MDRYIIIVAAGSGKRFGGDIPKQFVEFEGKPVLMHTMEAFNGYGTVIVVLNADYAEYWKGLCVKYGFTMPHKVVAGGAERFHSVKNALALIPDGALVAVHDGVRPFVTKDVIDEAFAAAERCGAAVPVTDCIDSVRILYEDGTVSKPFDRSRVKMVQTPQVFQSTLLKKAYNAYFNPAFTDDASVVEASGGKVTLTNGSSANIKITSSEDLKKH